MEIGLKIAIILTSNFVYILEWETKRLVSGSLGGINGVKGLDQAGSGNLLALWGLLAPSLEPLGVVRGLEHVVSVPSGDWDEGNNIGVVSDLLDVLGYLLLDLGETSLE